MIPRTETTWQRESPQSWQQQLKEAITEPEQLLKALNLDLKHLPAAKLACRDFPLKVPQAFLQRMEPGNIQDPLLRQILPVEEELIVRTGYGKDPLYEQSSPQPGLIQKYSGRVLLMVNGHCAVNCRYCFRRHFPYDDNKLNRQQWQGVLAQLREDTSISEVIYSGGDPLASSDRQLRWLTNEIVNIPHIKRLRVHSRLPVVIPDRITDDCLAWLTEHHLQTVFVFHINHPNELDKNLHYAIEKLQQKGVTLLNQTVLLKGVNDNIDVLAELSETLFASGVLPYYLHLLDKVAGAHHFDIPEVKALGLHKNLQNQLPGYLVPKLVREEAGKGSKTLVW